MVLRVVLVTGLVLSVMSVLANGSLARRLGATSTCSVVRVAHATQFKSCRGGWLGGMPNLSGKGCTSMGGTHGRQFWSCPIR